MRLRRAGEACARWSHASTLLPHQDAQVRSFACARARVTLTEGGEAADHRAAETHDGWRPVDCAILSAGDGFKLHKLNLRFAHYDSIHCVFCGTYSTWMAGAIRSLISGP